MDGEANETRTEILTATLKLAAKRGVAAITMAEVAKAAGVSRQAVYLHFGTRGKLMSEMMRRRLLEHPLAQEARRLSTPPASIDKFEAFIAATVRFTASVAGPALVEFAHTVHDKVVLAAVRERTVAGVQMTNRMMANLKRQGLLKPGWTVQEASEWTLAYLNPPHIYTLATLMNWPMERIIDRTVEALRRDVLKG